MAVRITWTDDNVYEEGYKVYRSESPMDPESLPAPIAELGVDATSWIDTTALSGRTYHYRVMVHAAGLEPQISAEMTISLAAGGTSMKPRADVVVALVTASASHVAAKEAKGALLDAGFSSGNILTVEMAGNIPPCDIVVLTRGTPDYARLTNLFLSGVPFVFGSEAGNSGSTTVTTYMGLTGPVDSAPDNAKSTMIITNEHYITQTLPLGIVPLRNAVTWGYAVSASGKVPGQLLATGDPSYVYKGRATLMAVEKGAELDIGGTTTARCVVWADLYQNGTVRSPAYTEILARSIDWCLGAGLGTPTPV